MAALHLSAENFKQEVLEAKGKVLVDFFATWCGPCRMMSPIVDQLADEMADVLWVLICLANQTGVNLTEAFRQNLEKKTNRDKDRHKNNPKL